MPTWTLNELYQQDPGEALIYGSPGAHVWWNW
jgi:hypothetical protein